MESKDKCAANVEEKTINLTIRINFSGIPLKVFRENNSSSIFKRQNVINGK